MLLTLLPVSALAIDPEPTETWADAVDTKPEGYTEEGNTITISTAKGLAWFAKQINTWESQPSNSKVDFADYTINITEDINLSGKLWTPIDTSTVIADESQSGYTTDRAGTYNNKLLDGAVINGNGHTITGMTVHNTVRGPIPGAEVSGGQSCYYYAGFIGRTNDTLTIQNLTFDQAVVDGNNEPTINETGGSSIAVVAGINGGNLTLQNVTVSNSTVSGYTKIAGFVGQQTNKLTVINSAVTGCTFNVLPCELDPEGGMGSPIIGINTANTANLSYQGVTVSGNKCVDQSTWQEKESFEDGLIRGKSSNGSWYVIWAPFSIDKSNTYLTPAASIDGACYLTLADAVAAAEDGETVELLKDVTLYQGVDIDKEIILELNGCTISAGSTEETPYTGDYLLAVKRGGDLTVNDSSDGETGAIASGDLEDVMVGIKLTIKGEAASGDPATLVVNGGKIEGYFYGISGNGTRHDTNVTVNGGTISAPHGAGIYQPQNGTLTIKGGQITGYETAVEIRSGNLIITDGTFTSTAEEFKCDPNGNGTTTVGAALAISQHTTKKDISVSISGGIFNGIKALNESNPQKNDPAPQVDLSISGGNFNAPVETVDVTGFITGGIFYSEPNDSYLGTGLIFVTEDEANGPWTVGPAQGMSADASAVNGTASAEVGGNFTGTENNGNVDGTSSTVAIDVTTDQDVTTTEVTIQGASLTSVKDAEDIDSVELTTDVGTVTLTKQAWDTITDNAIEAADGNDPAPVTLIISSIVEEDQVTGVKLTATANGSEVFSSENSGNAAITVSVPVPKLLDPDTIQVYYMSPTGPQPVDVRVSGENLVWTVNHFSEYRFTSGSDAACLTKSNGDSVFYYSLQDAIDAATAAGSIVTLLDDIDLSTDTNASLITVPGNRDITINCTDEQFTITGSYTNTNINDGKTRALFSIGDGSTVTLDNVGLNLTGNDQGTDGTLSGIRMGYGIYMGPGSHLKITNGSDVQLKTLNAGIASGTTGSTVEINGSTFTVDTVSGNGSNGGGWTVTNSTVEISNTGNHGLSVETLQASGSEITVDKAGYTGLYGKEIALNDTDVTVTNSGSSLAGTSYEGKGAVQIKQSEGASLSLANGSTLTLEGNVNADSDKLLYLGDANFIVSDDSRIDADLEGGKDAYLVTVMNGDLVIAQQTVTPDGEYKLPAAPTKEGYTFKGWDSDDDGTADAGASETVTITGNTTFTAVWEANPTTPGDDDTPSQPSGGDSSNDYFIDTGYSKYGKVTAYPGWAEAGDTVKLTVKPNSGYELSELSVTSSGKSVKLTAVGENQFTFTMPSGTVSVEATFTASNTPAPVIPSTGFVDVSASAWYYNAVNYVVDEGIMSGTGANTFEPNTTLTRAMVAQMLYAMSGKPNQGSNTFGDVDSSAWYADAVAWVSYKGVMTGYGEGRFAPNTPVTREQMALILYNYAKLQGYDTDASSSLSSFADGDSVSSWAQQAMSWAVAQGLFSGRDGNMLTPAGTATRAEIAQIFMQFCKNVAE